MKKVLILVLSADFPPYDKMIQTSKATWDSIEVEGCKTHFYCCASDSIDHKEGVVYLDVRNGFYEMGYKNIAMFEWILKNEDFDYVARVNASCYVDKKNLMEYVQDLPAENVFAGIVVKEQYSQEWCWGGMQFIISRDVIQLMVDGQREWDHTKMEDVAMSFLVNKFEVPFTNAKGCSIDKTDNGWMCLSYNDKSFEFTDFNDLKKVKHHFYRVKQDGKRWVDEFLMHQLYNTLK